MLCRIIELVIIAGQPPDVASSGALQKGKVQCAENETPAIEEAQRASVDSEDDVPAEPRVRPTFANNQRTYNVVGGKCVGATEQLSAITLQSSTHNKKVEPLVNDQVVVKDFGLTFANIKDSASLKVESAETMLPAVLSVERNPAGFAKRSSVRRRLREKTKPVLINTTRSAGEEQGARDSKRLRNGVSTEISASDRAIASSKGVHTVLESV